MALSGGREITRSGVLPSSSSSSLHSLSSLIFRELHLVGFHSNAAFMTEKKEKPRPKGDYLLLFAAERNFSLTPVKHAKGASERSGRQMMSRAKDTIYWHEARE